MGGKIAGYIFTVVIPVVVAAMLPHIGPEIGFPIILVSLVAGLSDFAWMYSKAHHGQPQMLLICGMAFGALVLGGCAIAFFLIPSSNKGASLDGTLLLECFFSQFPTAIPSYGLYYWELTNSAGDGGFLSASQQPGTPITWNMGEPGYWNACQFTNYGPGPIVRLEGDFTLRYMETIRDKNGGNRGTQNVISSKQIRNPPVRIGVGDKNTFVFYMRNRTPFWTQILIPEVVRIQTVGSNDWQTVKLISADFPKNVASLPPYFPDTPSQPQQNN